MTIYANKVSRKQLNINSDTIVYTGTNPETGKTINVYSSGHLNHNGSFQIMAARQDRWLMQVVSIYETSANAKADSYYICD